MKKKHSSISIIALITAAFICISFSTQNSSDHKVLFEKAKFTMETKGDLKGAIRFFEELISKYPNQRGYAAKSQFYIGLCLEKQGLKEAQQAFQKVVDNYPEQIEAVMMAKEKLITLRRIHQFVETGNEEFMIRQVWADPESDVDVWGGDISPDGRFHAFIDWNKSGDIAVLEVATQEIIRPSGRTRWDPSGGYAMYPKWSPDNKKIVYFWAEGGEKSGLYMIGREGSNSSLLYKDESWPWIVPHDWSNDGQYILASLSKGRYMMPVRIVLISLEDYSVNVLKTLNLNVIGSAAEHMNLSPDGKFVVYARPSKKGDLNNDIFLLSVENKNEIPLVEHPAEDFLLGWSPDGKWVLFASDRTGSVDAWMIPVRDGKPQGSPELIKKGIGEIEPIGFTNTGSFYYGFSNLMQDVYIFCMDPGKGEILALPKKAALPGEGRNIEPAYSPDGKYMAYTRISMSDKRPNSLCIYSLETGEEREFPLKIEVVSPKWSPDGSSIFLTGKFEFHHFGLYKVNVQKGVLTPIPTDKPQEIAFGSFFIGSCNDGKSFVYQHIDEKNNLTRVFCRSLEDGAEKEIYRLPHRLGLTASMSPDSQWIAFVSREKERTLRIMPVTGGDLKELYTFEHVGGHPTALTWTADGKYILFSLSERKRGLPTSIWRIPVSGGIPQDLGFKMKFFNNISAHPNGKQFAFSSYGTEYRPSEVWVMENFLPLAKTEKE